MWYEYPRPCLGDALLGAVIQVGGVPVTLLDTAGLREATDVVEQVGVQRAARAAADADVVALVFDAQVRMSWGVSGLGRWCAGVQPQRAMACSRPGTGGCAAGCSLCC